MSLPFACAPVSSNSNMCNIKESPSSSALLSDMLITNSNIVNYPKAKSSHRRVTNLTLLQLHDLLEYNAISESHRRNPFKFPDVSQGQAIGAEADVTIDNSTVITTRPKHTPGHKAPFVPSSTFDPVSMGLSPEFILTDYTKLKGCSCKVPQPKLLELLRDIQASPERRGTHGEGHKGNVGMDCSIVRLGPNCIDRQTQEPLLLISTTDFFFPSVEDPYLQGRIGAANVLSDLYSMGITTCDSMLMLLAASTDMDEGDRYVSTILIMRGYADTCREAGVDVTGGQTVLNPWPLIGGVAMACTVESRMVMPSGKLAVGDVLVLTKPIGGQIAINVKQWVQRPSPWYDQFIYGNMSLEEIDEMYTTATEAMARLNRNAAELMLKYKATAATDITGFGLIGHSVNLIESQPNGGEDMQIVLDTIPTIEGSIKASLLINDKYKLFQGLSAETSGGLLVALRSVEDAASYIQEIQELDGKEAWIVGKVIHRHKDSDGVIGPSAVIPLDAVFIGV
eukprot:Tbor_TRINITY_DN2634_c0_g1::TRINITY_DN2634_c0_g1_i1::g.18039::m.18039/K01008/selD, SEPHS; selenide, water dikinase